MKAIQVTGKIDAQSQLSLDHPIEGTLSVRVRVIILFAEAEADTDEFWESVSGYQHTIWQS